MPAPLPKMDTSVTPKSVKSTYGFSGSSGTPDKAPGVYMGDRFSAEGIDSGEQSESIDSDFCNSMYGNLALTLKGHNGNKTNIGG